MHEPECQNELEKSPSCQQRDDQKTVYPVTYLSPVLTRSLLPAYYIRTCSQVGRFHTSKVTILCNAACGNKLLKTNQEQE